MFLRVQLFSLICHISTALLSLRSRSGRRFAMIHRNCNKQSFHRPLIQLNMPPKISHRNFTFEFLVFHSDVQTSSSQFQSSLPGNDPCIHLPDIPNRMLIHTRKIVTVLFQVQIVAKLIVNTRIDVVLLEKHVCHQLVTRVLLPMLGCFPRSIHCCLEPPKS